MTESEPCKQAMRDELGRFQRGHKLNIGASATIKGWETRRKKFGENAGSISVLKGWKTRRGKG